MRRFDLAHLECLYDAGRTRVYRGAVDDDGRPVVLKVLRQAFPSAETVAQLRHEHDVIRALEVPGVIRTSGLVERDDSVFLMLEDIGGESLAQACRKRRLTLPAFLDVAVALSGALAQVHQRGVIHKDVNPSNVVWNAQTGELRLIDFGLASRVSRERVEADPPSRLEGTLRYVSPEQTGRVNRSVDYRTDLYSLGATFYFLLTGKNLFDLSDPVELIHAHIARRPPRPSEADAAVPPILDAIVAKLLEKNPEDRYQSALGVKLDLERCRRTLDPAGGVPEFPLGQGDVVDRLRVPEKLYGRGDETRTLLEAFDEAAQGPVSVILVRGYSGVGKTSLVREVHRPILERRGHFLAGKFDQFQRGVPYASLIQAFRQFVREILAESPERVRAWGDRIVEAVAPNARVLIDVIPELAHVLGDPPSVQALPPSEAENRFNVVLRRFVRCIARPDHPLVLFLDDLQWADLPTLRLLAQLARDGESRHLLVIGAYRENEVGPTHPLAETLRRLQESGVEVDEIALAPLREPHVCELVADTLKLSQAEVAPLAALCSEKTQGNPFFLNQFLEGLYEEGLLGFDLEAARWRWNLEEIRARNITDNVVEFMARKLAQLPDATRQSLWMAAVVGTHFTVGLLARMRELDVDDARADLQPALDEGLVLEGAETPEGRGYTFLHDRVQQAAYAIADDAARTRAHVTLGRLLLGERSPEEAGEHLFEIVAHLNQGIPIIGADDAREQLARLNFEAARKAKEAAAYAPAEEYARVALELLPREPFARVPRFAMDVHLVAAETAFLTGSYAAMDERVDAILAASRDPLDTVRAYEIRVDALNAQNDLLGAVKANLAALRTLGLELPEQPGQADVIKELVRTKVLLARKPVEQIRELPLSEDPRVHAAADILVALIGPAYYAAPNLVPLVAFNAVRLGIEKGLAPGTATGFSVYGLVLCTLNDFAGAYRYGQLAMAITERFGRHRQTNRARHLFNTHVRFWTDHWRDSLPPLAENHLDAYADGDFEYAAFSGFMYCTIAASVGLPLAPVLEEMDRYAAALADMQQGTSGMTLAIMHQAALNLAGRGAEDPTELRGTAYDERVQVAIHREANDGANLFVYHSQKCMLGYLFREPDVVLASAVQNAEFEAGAASTVFIPIAVFFEALAQLAVFPSLSLADKAQASVKLVGHVRRLRKWAAAAPQNLAHRAALVEAELARVMGRRERAVLLYESALRGAQAGGWENDVALIKELAGRFQLEQGNTTIGRAYLREARFAYQQWGAHAKVEQLEREYPFSAPLAVSAEDDGSVSVSGTEVGDSLDLRTVLRASQAVSQEIVLDRLLERLLVTALESGGAERAFLVLDSESGPRVEAVADAEAGASVLDEPVPLEAASQLARGVVTYVLRTGESVVLADAASEGEFQRDPYVQAHRPRSVLCTAIAHQGGVRGALYLENNLTAGAFTPARLQILQILGGQSAISLENARLYDQLEAKVRERTKQLEVRNEFIRATFGRYLSSDVVDELLERPGGLHLGGESRTVTILMTDLRGFSTLSEDLDPEQVITLLNNYLGVMTEVILEYGGTIDEFIGDAILVLFGAPIDREDHAARAVACAVAMQRAMDKVNRMNVEAGLPSLDMGIGVHTGSVVVGNIGSRQRAKYGVVGAVVNETSRIESYTSGGQILVSEATHAAAEVELTIDHSFTVLPKGLREPIEVHDVRGVGAPFDLGLPERDRQVRRLDSEIPASVAVAGDDGEFGAPIEAALVGVGDDEIVLRCTADVPEGAVLRLTLRGGNGEGPMVLDGEAVILPDAEDTLGLRISALPRTRRADLERRVAVTP